MTYGGMVDVKRVILLIYKEWRMQSEKTKREIFNKIQ